MSVARVKELFFDATNSKVVIGGGDDDYVQAKLTEAHHLALLLQDEIWPYIPAYRLAHLLFRQASKEHDFFEIVNLLEHAEKSGSNYISLNASLLKFAAINRLNLLGTKVSAGDQLACVETIVGKISAVSEKERNLDVWNKPIQSDYFNILEYLVYATAFDYEPLIGVGHDDRNTLFPRFNNDIWTIIGTRGPVDKFCYNYENGIIELNRLCEAENVTGYFVLGEPHETRIFNFSGKSKTQFRPIQLLNKIMANSNYGAEAARLAEIWEGVADPSETAKKSRKSLEKFLGGNVFHFNSATNRWSISEDARIYGLVKRQHRSESKDPNRE
jgi:hypothetical protein